MAGQIVGVVFFIESTTEESSKMLSAMFASQPSARSLVETEGSHNVTIREIVLVRRTIAWITGVILLISTLLGVRLNIDKGLVAAFIQVTFKINTG